MNRWLASFALWCLFSPSTGASTLPPLEARVPSRLEEAVFALG